MLKIKIMQTKVTETEKKSNVLDTKRIKKARDSVLVSFICVLDVLKSDLKYKYFFSNVTEVMKLFPFQSLLKGIYLK